MSWDAWQVAQGQWEHVPASHEQLLRLFGVSTQTAVWIAATMLECPGFDLPSSPASLLPLNPHCLAADLHLFDGDLVPELKAAADELQAAVDELRPQLQQWAATPLELLLQPVLLYSIAYAAAGKEGLLAQYWLQCCPAKDRAAAPAGSPGHAGTSEQAAGKPNATTKLSSLPVAVLDEMLPLNLALLQSLQQGQQQQRNTSSSSSSSSSRVPAAGAAVALFEREFAAEAETTLVGQLLGLLEDVHAALLASAAPAAAGQAMLTLLDAGVTQEQTAASTAAEAAEAAAATAEHATAEGTGGESAAGLPALWQQQAGAIFTALEAMARTQSRSASVIVQATMARCIVLNGRKQLLLRLALTHGSSGVQQMRVEFFRLMVTLLKLSGAGDLCGGDDRLSCRLSGEVAHTAVHVLTTLAAGSAASDSTGCALREGGGGDGDAGSSNSSAALWLLLLSRCCLMWAAELQQADKQCTSWVQVIQETHCWEQFAHDLGSSEQRQQATIAWCFGTIEPWLLRVARQLSLLLQEGSSLRAGLSAAGYDMDFIAWDLYSLTACYPEVAQTEGVPNAVVAERVDGLIKLLVSLGQGLSVFAVPHCCNNPSCSNISGRTEKGIVCGKGCSCSGCKVTRYCGKACQVAHWRVHKPVCKMLAAAAAAGKP